MTSEELDGWQEKFERYHHRFGHLFARREPREQSAKYLRGLMGTLPRKNGWQLAEAVGDATPDATQRLLYQARWHADAARDVYLQFVVECFGDPEAIGVVDETGFLKQGTASVGVARQYTGTAGKTANCQVGTFLSYATDQAQLLLDRRLYLPEVWCHDTARRQQAKVPEQIGFHTKPQQAWEMLEHAWNQGVPMRWVVGDEVYGNATHLRDKVHDAQRWYVLAVASNTPVWRSWPPLVHPRPGKCRRRRRKKPRLAPTAPQATTVKEVFLSWPCWRWHRLTVAEGEKGPKTYDWACQRIVESRQGLPSREGWLLVRRSIGNPADISYYLSNAPQETSLLRLAQVASMRYTVEQCIEETKGEVGLDEYEVRSWPSWHRHITLSMMAHGFLASLRLEAMARPLEEPWLAELTVPEVKRLLEIALPLPERSIELRLAWSDFRRAKRKQARKSHARARRNNQFKHLQHHRPPP
ncbi:IS701 family transposase [Candidatus Parcubacteria bacterium]|nr:MAG: IS701 family transposase [Candidatus Parcubacteria bacterium]